MECFGKLIIETWFMIHTCNAFLYIYVFVDCLKLLISVVSCKMIMIYHWNKYLCVLHAWNNFVCFLCFLFCSDINSGLLCLIVHRIFIFVLFALLYVGGKKVRENPKKKILAGLLYRFIFIIVYFLLLAIIFDVMDFILYLCIM